MCQQINEKSYVTFPLVYIDQDKKWLLVIFIGDNIMIQAAKDLIERELALGHVEHANRLKELYKGAS